MQPREFLDIITLAEKLKDVPRHCYTSGGRRESVAEHCWRIALMAFFLTDEFPEADMYRVIKMCLIHDLGEMFTGDIPVFDKTAADENKEAQLLENWMKTLPGCYQDEMSALFEEMTDLETLEAKIFKALDSLEAIIQHNESDIKTWLPHEYDLNLTYAYDKIGFSPYFETLREEIKKDTVKKINEEKQQ